jgi:hypothetical protein
MSEGAIQKESAQRRSPSAGFAALPQAAEAPRPEPHPMLALQRAAGNRAVSELVQRLRASRPAAPAQPMIQRKCSACSREEDELSSAPRGIQPRVKVGPVDDPFEREADRVAALVTGSAGPAAVAPPARPAAPAPAEARRAVTGAAPAGGSPADAAAPKSEPDEEAREREPGEDGQLHASSLTSGGEPLPPPVRDFYEGRFGHDFAGVRVHVGHDAIRRTEAIDAFAFTYGHHVWLGRGQPVAPSFVLAHELAHVVQQTQPPLARAARAAAPVERSAAPSVQRSYWVPREAARNSGPFTHTLVLPDIAKESGALTEVGVPNAKKGTLGVGTTNVGYGDKGRADLYQGTDKTGKSRSPGLYFTGHESVETLPAAAANPAPTRSRKPGAIVERVNLAPVVVKVGDLKPSYGTLEAKEGPEQLKSYVDGFEFARKEVNALSAAGKALPAGKTWDRVEFRAFHRDEIKVPAMWGSGAGQKPHKLALHSGLGVLVPKRDVLGRVYVGDAVGGILAYTWIPDTVGPGEQLHGTLLTLRDHVDRNLITPVIASPLSASPTRPAPLLRPRAPAPRASAPGLTADGAGLVRRRAAEAKPKPEDPFVANYDKPGGWKASLALYTKQFQAFGRSSDFESADFRTAALKAQKDAHEAGVSRVPALGAAEEKESKTLGKVDFWTGTSASIVGYFRKIFGATFVKLYNLYINVRTRLAARLKSRPETTGGKSGLLGSALKVVFKLLKMAGKVVLNEVLNTLAHSLVSGVTKKLQALLPVDRIEELQAKVEEVRALGEHLETSALGKIDSFLTDVIGPFDGVLGTIEKVRSAFSTINTIVSVVRWGARAIACLSPPALGCLWIIAQGVMEKFASMVVETCWFQKKIAPLIFKVNYVRRELPRTIASFVRDQIVKILPASLGDLFAPIEPEVDVGASDVECGTDPAGAELTPERQAMLDVLEKLRTERCGGDADCAEALLQAYADLAMRAGIDGARKLTPDEIRQAGAKLVDSGVTAAELAQLAQKYTPTPGGKEADLATFIEEMKKNPTGTGNLPPTDEPASAGADTGGQGSGATAGTSGRGGGQGSGASAGTGSQTAGSGGASGGVPVLDATTRLRQGIKHVAGNQRAYGSKVENASLAHTPKTPPQKLDLTVGIYLRATFAKLFEVAHVPAVATAKPKRFDKNVMEIKYRATNTGDIDLSPNLPGGFIVPDQELVGYVKA